MGSSENRLVFACKQVGEAAAEILEWVDANGEFVGGERIALLQDVHRTEVAAERLAAAVHQPPAVAFVGPRRSGRTHAITSLIEPTAGRIPMRFDGIRDPIDYMRLIVPDSTRYGTAMAIRLSEHGKPLPQNFPVAMRLLSLADVVMILGNAFFTVSAERDQVPTMADVREAHALAMTRLNPDPVPGLTEEDVWDIQTYFLHRFGDEPLVRTLSAAGFWASLAKLAPYLSNESRGELLAQLWGGLQPFTATFVTLGNVLSNLGGGLEASSALDAILGLDPRSGKLSKRTDSILSGETVTHLGQPDTQTVVVCNEFGQWVSLSRTAIAALAAEVRLPLGRESSEVTGKADLMEMPGIDARDTVAGLGRALARDATLLGRIFLQAKAVHLLDRYTQEHKITSMVVCIDPATRRVGELASLVGRWVTATHGADAATRESHENALFVAFTKVDRELVDQPHQKDRKIDWAGRIHSVLVAELGRDHGWPMEWTPSRPFDSIHLLRNPTCKTKQLFDYSSDGREAGIKSAQQARVERTRLEFLADDVIRRHVADPVSVWNEAMLLNDGGISYLAQSIAGVADVRVRNQQIVSALGDLRQSLKDRLQRYYLSEHFSFQYDRRRAAALLVVRRLRGCAEQRRLGHLLRALQLPDTEFADVLANLEVWAGPAQGGAPGKLNGTHAAPAGEGAATAESALLNGSHQASEDAARLARTAIDHWVQTMRAMAHAADAVRSYQMPRTALQNLVDELIAGAARTELDRRLTQSIQQVTAGEGVSPGAIAKAAMCASSTIGDYVMCLGFADVFSNSHPRRKGKAQQPIFLPRQTTAIDSVAEPVDERQFYSDWSQAFLAMVDENAGGLRERNVSDEQNRRLGRLLRLLDVSL